MKIPVLLRPNSSNLNFLMLPVLCNMNTNHAKKHLPQPRPLHNSTIDATVFRADANNLVAVDFDLILIHTSTARMIPNVRNT